MASSSGSPGHSATLLTPPLTPSSMSNSASHEVPSTPPESNSPLRWTHAPEKAYTGSVGLSDAAFPPTGIKGSATVSLTRPGYLTPSSGRSQSISSETSSSYASSHADVISTLAAGVSDMDITPRDEKKVVLETQSHVADATANLFLRFGIDDQTTETTPSRFILVSVT